MHTAPAAGDEEAIERKIAVRAARQERLTAEDPPEFWAVQSMFNYLFAKALDPDESKNMIAGWRQS